MLKTMIFLCSFLSAIVSSASADIMDEVRKKYDLSQTIESDFEVDIYWYIREREEHKEGSFIIAPGDKFTVSLDKTHWICDGQTYWQYNENAGQVIIKRLLDIDLSAHPSQMLMKYLHEYQYSLKEKKKKELILEWTRPAAGANANSYYQSIILTIDRENHIVLSLKVTDKNQNVSTYTFKKTKFNITPQPGAFTFDVPKGVSVLDVRE